MRPPAAAAGGGRGEKLSLLLAAALPDPARLLLHLSTTPRVSEDSSPESSDGDGEGAADEGAEGWMEEREDRRRRNRGKKEEDSLDWLSSCILESWGGAEYVAVARGASVALLGKRADALQMLFAKPLPLDDGEEISCVLLMGVGSRRVSGSIDGLVLLIGTSDGRLSLFSEAGAPLFSHRFTPAPITAMRSSGENVLLVSEHEMVLIDRRSLYGLVAEARKVGGGKKRVELEYSVLNRLSGETSMDAVAAPYGPSTMDRYAEVAMKKFHGRLERSRAGDAVYWLSLRESYGAAAAWESEQREGVRETIVKWGAQYLPSFLQSAMQSPELKPTETKTAVSWRVMGETRFAISLHPAPEGVPLAAVADNLARVAIVETTTGQIVRVWKGYRDASCGWIRVKGEKGKHALFLAILAPRRNLLEIWSAPNGRRVAARQVRGLALLESSCAVMSDDGAKNGGGGGGRREETEGGGEESGGRLFLLGCKGNMYEISVAFDSLLQLNTDDEQHDRMLLKETEVFSLSSVPPLVAALKTAGAKRMALISYIHLARQVRETEAVLKELAKVESLAPLCGSLLSLCQSYARLASLWERERSGGGERSKEEEEEGENGLDQEEDGEKKEEEEEEGRLPPEFDAETYLELRALVEKCVEEMERRKSDLRSSSSCFSPPPTLTYSAASLPLGLHEFITSFNLHATPVKLSLSGGDPLPFLAFLFTPLMERRVEVDEFVCAAAALHIGQADLSSLFTSYWQQTETITMDQISPTIWILSSLLSKTKQEESRGHRSSRRHSSSSSSMSGEELKERMEEGARKSSDPLRGAILLTLLSLFSHHESEQEEEEEEEFETVREDVQRLEGILRVAPLLARLSALSSSSLEEPEALTMSIAQLMEGGSGGMREQVARLVSADRLLPAQLLQHERLAALREALPHSLDASLLCAETAWTLMREWTGKSSFESCKLAVEYAKAVVDRRLRSQLASLLWSTTLLGALKAVSNQSRGAERDLHAQLVPSHRVADFITCLFSLLSSLVQETDGDEESETIMESERARLEEWIEPVMEGRRRRGEKDEEEGEKRKKGKRGTLSQVPAVKCESLVEVLQRQPRINDQTLHLHRVLLAGIHVTIAVGRSPSAVRDLFPAQLHGSLFSGLQMRVKGGEDEDEAEVKRRRSALIERACNYPNPSIRDSLLFLCREWALMELWQASDARRCLREGREDDGCLLLASLPLRLRVAILQPAVAARLKHLAAESDVIMLSAKDERTLSELVGDEFVDETTAGGTRKLLVMLKSMAGAAAATKQLVAIGSSYFGLDV